MKHKIETTMHISPEDGHRSSLGINKQYAPKWSSLAENWLQLLFVDSQSFDNIK